MDDRRGFSRDNKKTKYTKSQKGQEMIANVLNAHNRLKNNNTNTKKKKKFPTNIYLNKYTHKNKRSHI